jgi:hypothetical protein
VGARCGLLAAVLTLAAGCIDWDKTPATPPPTPPTGKACEVSCTWMQEVAHVPDPARHGARNPGLAGRLYLFGDLASGHSLAVDGKAEIVLYDLSGEKEKMLEVWQFGPNALKQLLRRDPIGWGYTLFLPWGTYRPDISRVELRVSFTPTGEATLYAEPSTVTLQHGATPNGPVVVEAAKPHH